MARLLSVALSCFGLLHVQLPDTLCSRRGGSPQPCRPGEPPAGTPARRLQPQHPAPWPGTGKPRQALQPRRSASLPPAGGRPLRAGPRRHSGPPVPRAPLLRAGCVLGTCQVQNLSHRLWQLVASAGPRDSAPIDPSSPHSYG
ncbi:protein ADM2 [Pteronotus mesoamericanus]|uniref:protein ADM2 n=1 Tax=Pteronotus mesoamericanus TaxID=1884717 RepID=UPI0023ED0968|nr:protein ADM2 [Pteronotus parnellii mesoamericanus]